MALGKRLRHGAAAAQHTAGYGSVGWGNLGRTANLRSFSIDKRSARTLAETTVGHKRLYRMPVMGQARPPRHSIYISVSPLLRQTVYIEVIAFTLPLLPN